MKELPVLYNRKEECYGCTACYAICPRNAITMVEDEEGFEYPQIDENKCVECSMCLKACPSKINDTPPRLDEKTAPRYT
jgi:ferredoxin